MVECAASNVAAPAAVTAAVADAPAEEPTIDAAAQPSVLGAGDTVAPDSALGRWALSHVRTLLGVGDVADVCVAPLVVPAAAALAAARAAASAPGGCGSGGPGGAWLLSWWPVGVPVLALTTGRGSLLLIAPRGGGGGSGGGAGNVAAVHAAPSIALVPYPCPVLPASLPEGALAPPPGTFSHLTLVVGVLVTDVSRGGGGGGGRVRLLLTDVAAYGGASVAHKPALKRLGVLKQWVAKAFTVTGGDAAARARAAAVSFHGAVFRGPSPVSRAELALLLRTTLPSLPHAAVGAAFLRAAAPLQLQAAAHQPLADHAPAGAAAAAAVAAPLPPSFVVPAEGGAGRPPVTAAASAALEALVDALASERAGGGGGGGGGGGAGCAPPPRSLPPASAPAPSSAGGGVRLLVIVPYRDQPAQNRAEQLRRFAAALPAYLRSPCVAPPLAALHVLVIEQSDDGFKFNRGKALNVGLAVAAEASAGGPGGRAAAARYGLPPDAPPFDSLCLHDVDLLPAGPALGPWYGRPPAPRPLHLGAAWTRYAYDRYVGGILTLSPGAARATNGFPNNYWGWGGEDDEMAFRLEAAGLWPPERPGPDVAAAGAVTDLEEVLLGERGGERAGTGVARGGREEWRNMLKRELYAAAPATWRSNGLNTLRWAPLCARRLSPDVTVLTVDLRGSDDPMAVAQLPAGAGSGGGGGAAGAGAAGAVAAATGSSECDGDGSRV